MALVSIIIPAHNASNTLAACIEACVRQTYRPVEIIVVDDGSTDDTPRIARTYPVHYVRQEQRGPAAARNRGAHEAKGVILAFTDSDCVPAEDWMVQLIEGLDEDVAVVGGTYGIANPGIELARMIHEEIVLRHARYDEHVDFLGSFNMAIRRDAFDRVGGFDETFRAASGEDNDLSYRLTEAGGKLRFMKSAVVAHYHPTRLWPYLRAQARHGFWRMKLYAKHPARVSGDRYAGWPDLMAPVLVVLAAFLVVLSLIGPPAPFYAGAILGLLLTLLAVRIRVPWGMYQRTHDRRMLGFVFVLLARDVARAIGMVGGIYTFLIRRKAAA
jgi:glycosyltransferase involved in cell wall biosynthesis